MKIGFILTSGYMGGYQTQFIDLANLFSINYQTYLSICRQDYIDPMVKNRIKQTVEYTSIEEVIKKSDIIQIDSGFPKHSRKLLKKKWDMVVVWYCTTYRVPFFERIVNRYTPKNVLTCSDFVSQLLKIKNTKINMGVDTSFFKPMPDIKKKYDIMIIGRMRDVKNHKLFIDIANKGNFSFLTIGGTATWNTGHVNQIEHYVRENAKEGIDLVTGVIPNEKVPYYINQAKIALVVSKKEALGFNSIEPMSCGVPAICRDVGGVSEAVKDFPYLLVDFHAPPDDYVEKINRYLNDEKLRINVRKSVEDHFAIEKTFINLKSYYQKLYKEKNE